MRRYPSTIRSDRGRPAQPADKKTTGTTTMIHNSLGNATTPVVIDIRDIENRTRQISEAVTYTVDNHERMMSLADIVADPEARNHLYSTTAFSLHKLQTTLRSLYHQMTNYAVAIGPDDTQFHQVRANAAAALEIADIYLSPTTAPHPILRPGATQHEGAGILNAAIEAPTRPTTPVQVGGGPTIIMMAPPEGGTTDDASMMQVDDELETYDFLQLDLRPDERQEIDRLLEEPMEHPSNPLATGGDSRDWSYMLTFEPTLPLLGPVDVEVTVETSVGPEVPIEEIVDNKTIRIDDGEPLPEILGTQIICQGCTRVGHEASSCPLTNFQQHKLKRWIEKGNDRLLTSSDDSVTDPLLSPKKPVPLSTPRVLTSDDSGARTSPVAPAPTAERISESTATTPPQEAPPPPMGQQQASGDEEMSSADHLLSAPGGGLEGQHNPTPGRYPANQPRLSGESSMTF